LIDVRVIFLELYPYIGGEQRTQNEIKVVNVVEKV